MIKTHGLFEESWDFSKEVAITCSQAVQRTAKKRDITDIGKAANFFFIII